MNIYLFFGSVPVWFSVLGLYAIPKHEVEGD